MNAGGSIRAPRDLFECVQMRTANGPSCGRLAGIFLVPAAGRCGLLDGPQYATFTSVPWFASAEVCASETEYSGQFLGGIGLA